MAQATFYDPTTKSRKAYEIGTQPKGSFLEEKIANPSAIKDYTVTYKDANSLYGYKNTPAQTNPVIKQSLLQPSTSAIKDIASNKQLGVNRLKGFFGSSTFNPAALDQVANTSFLNAVSLAATGGVDQGIMGLNQQMKVRDVLDKYSLGQYAPNMNIKTPEPETPAGGTTGTGTTGTTGTTPEPKGSETLSELDKLIKERIDQLGTPIDLTETRKAADAAAMDLEKSRQLIADKELLDAVTLEGIGNKPISMTMIQRQQGKYTQDQYIDNLKNAQDYNNKLILSKMAAGQYQEALNDNKEIASDLYEIRKLDIERAKEKDLISEKEAERLEQQSQYERDLTLKYGMRKISGPSELAMLAKNVGITPQNEQQYLYRDPITKAIYLKPQEEMQYTSGTVQEYEYYRKQEEAAGRKPMSFNEYQTADANRKFGSTRSSGGGGGSRGSIQTEEPTWDNDLAQAADMVITGEKRLGKGIDPNAYWNIVKQLTEASGVYSEADVDSLLINEINRKKGITYSPDQQDVSDFVVGQTIKPEAPTSKTGYTIDGKTYKTIDDVAAALGEDVAKKIQNTPITGWSIPGGTNTKLKPGQYTIEYGRPDIYGKKKKMVVEETFTSKQSKKK